MSAVVEPVGRDVSRTGLLTTENLSATVRVLDGSAINTMLGGWFGWAAAVITLLAFATTWQRT